MNLEINEKFGSIMIIVPHQDDEILMTAGVIRKAVKVGVECTIVMATNGDYGCGNYSKGYARLKESIAGLKVLGLSENSFEIMGYADTGMPREDSFLVHLYQEEDEEKVYPSSCTQETYGLVDKLEIHLRICGKHGLYNRRNFKEDLKHIIREKQPNNIFTTSKYDTHGDHEALYDFVCEVLDELKQEEEYEPGLYCGLIHSCAGDEIWPLRNTGTFTCPKRFENTEDCPWELRYVLELPEEMQSDRGRENLKYQALLKHETALKPDAYEFLMAFIKDEEIFWKMR